MGGVHSVIPESMSDKACYTLRTVLKTMSQILPYGKKVNPLLSLVEKGKPAAYW